LVQFMITPFKRHYKISYGSVINALDYTFNNAAAVLTS
jgi:hypothetical protein